MIEPPNDPKAEAAAAAAKGLVSAIPLAGGLISEIGNLYLNPLEKRKQKWMEDVSDALNKIRDELNILPEQLESNDAFISALYQATEIAMRNHQSEKRAALRNALISSAATDQNQELETRLLRYVDELGLTHIRLLSNLNIHAGQFSRDKKLDQIYARTCDLMPNIDRILFRSILQDLETRFLITLGDVEDFAEHKSKKDPVFIGATEIRSIEVTGLGRSFLTYIRADQL